VASQSQSKYSSLEFFISEGIKHTFINKCASVGLEAKRVECFSANPIIREYLSIAFERGQKYVPQLLKVLSMLQRKTSIKIEIAAEKKFSTSEEYRQKMRLN